MEITRLTFGEQGDLVSTTIRTATAADCYDFARDELAKARLARDMLRAIKEGDWSDPFDADFVEEATRDGLAHLLDCLVKAEGWRAHARAARRRV